jgi:hypothetical protein
MSLRRYNPRRDENEQAIVQALLVQGFHVTRLNATGIPDLLVHKGGAMWLAEVKQPKGRYTSTQREFYEEWQGPPIVTLRSVDDALRFQVLACEAGR